MRAPRRRRRARGEAALELRDSRIAAQRWSHNNLQHRQCTPQCYTGSALAAALWHWHWHSHRHEYAVWSRGHAGGAAPGRQTVWRRRAAHSMPLPHAAPHASASASACACAVATRRTACSIHCGRINSSLRVVKYNTGR